MSTPGRRVAARIAWRHARRAPWRTALVLLTVGLPVAALSLGLVLIATGVPTAEERATEQMGSAELSMNGVGPGARRRVEGSLPEGSRLVSSRSVYSENVIGGELIGTPLVEWEAPVDRDPVEGIYTLRGGRFPVTVGEVALHRTTLEQLGAAVGDPVELGDVGLRLRITGVVAQAGNFNDTIALVGPGTLDGTEAGPDQALIDVPAGVDLNAVGRAIQAAAPMAAGTLMSRSETALLDANARVVANAWVFGGTALALFGTGLVAAAAFVVGARRQLRTLGLIGAAGAEPRQIRRVVLMGGLVLGVTASGAGVALGSVLAVVLRPAAEAWAGRSMTPLEVPLLGLVAACLLGTASATLAAYGPARAAARLSTMDALAGRSAPPRPPGRVARQGVVLLVAAGGGLVAATVTRWIPGLIASLVAMVCGFLLAIPLVTSWTGRLAGRFPTVLRLAARDVARHGRRTGAALAAATMVLAFPVAVSALTLSEEASALAGRPPPMAEDQLVVSMTGAGDQPGEDARNLVRDLRAALPEGSLLEPLLPATYTAPLEPGGPEELFTVYVLGPERIEPDGATYRSNGPLIVGGPDLLQALHAEDGIDALRAGRIVGLGPGSVEGETVELMLDPLEEDVKRVAAVEAGPSRFASLGLGGEDNYLISPEAAGRLGLGTRPVPDFGSFWIVRLPSNVDGSTLEAAEAVASGYPGAYVTSAGSQAGPREDAVRLVATAGAAGVALAIVGVVVALVGAESRRDHAILVAVGAGPSMRRKVAAANGWLLATLGGLLAVPAGLVPVIVIQMARQAGKVVVVPWTAVGVALVGVPLVIAALSAAVSRQPRAAQLLRPVS